MGMTLDAATFNELTPRELHEIYKLRVDIFVHEQQCCYQEIDDIDARLGTVHLQVRDDQGTLAGVARIFPDTWEAIAEEVALDEGVAVAGQPVAHFGRLCVAPEFRGTEVAGLLLDYALGNPGRTVFITAQSPLRGYYERHGFEVCGPEFDWDGMAHLPMVRAAR